MNTHDTLEREIVTWMADEALGSPDEVAFASIMTATGRRRPRPRWLALIKEPPMRINSTVGVGSPIARLAVILATTLLLAVLCVGALVVGAQSPSPAPAETPPLSFFTGMDHGGACPIAEPVEELVDGVLQARGVSWGCQEWTTSDPRFSGTLTAIWNTDTVTLEDGRGEITSALIRLENGAGAWEGTATELMIGNTFHGSAGRLTGEGAYDGLVAYIMRDDAGSIRGVIRPDDGFGPPPAFVEQ